MRAQARKEGIGLSTAGWRQDFENRLEQADWPVRLRVLLARRQFQPALGLVETKLAELGEATPALRQTVKIAWTQAMLHKALVLACLEQWDDSLAVYAQVREMGVDPGRRFAAREAMWVLAATKRWQEFLKEVDAQDLKLVEGDVLTSFVKQARREVDKVSRQVGTQTQPSPP